LTQANIVTGDYRKRVLKKLAEILNLPNLCKAAKIDTKPLSSGSEVLL